MYIHNSGHPCLGLQKFGEFCEKHKIVYQPIEVENELDECSICLDDDKENKVKLMCGHIFHGKCIETWYTQKNNCPLCRQVITKTEIMSLTENHVFSFNPLDCITFMLFGCLFND
jgi:hypothetical protein